MTDEETQNEATEDVVEEPLAEAETEPMAAEAAPEAPVEETTPDPEPGPDLEVAADAEQIEDAVAEPAAEEAAGAAPGESSTAEDAPTSASAKRKRKRLPRSLRPQRTKTKREKPAERKPITRLPKPEHARGRRQERQGTVVSASADKTIVVRVDVAKVHPRYKKVVRRSSRFHAHDEQNQAKVGDVVRIVETRPLSRMKRWRLQEIVQAAK
jgi:small subunit ribosomal protein S17